MLEVREDETSLRKLSGGPAQLRTLEGTLEKNHCTEQCETRYARISICGTATTDFASFKVKFNCDVTSRKFEILIVVSFPSPHSYFTEVSVNTSQKCLRNDAVDSMKNGYAVGYTQPKTSVLVKFSVSFKCGVHTVFHIQACLIMRRFQIKCAEQLAFSRFVSLFISFGKRICVSSVKRFIATGFLMVL